jgi:3-phosphoshikimate 1-carboxyvinyltransferase
MNLVIQPTQTLAGEIDAPPSKLHTQLATVLTLLADGKSVIERPLKVGDTSNLLRAVEGLGATVKRTRERWIVWGTGAPPRPTGNVIDVRNSATALALMTAVASLPSRITVITGDEQLRARAMPVLLKSLRRLGAEVYSTKPDESPPFVVFGGELRGGKVKFEGPIAPHLLPPLLLPCPYAKKPVELRFTQKLKPEHQLALVSELMAAAGAKPIATARELKIPKKPYRAFRTQVAQDLASAAPFITAAILTDSKLRVRCIPPKAGRGEAFLGILEQMGASLRVSNRSLVIHGPQRLRGARLGLSTVPELLPFVAVLGCKARGKTLIRNAREAREMKSDRISAMVHELKRMGARVTERRDGLLIEGPSELVGDKLDGHNDYAVVAALVVAGLIARDKTIVTNRAEALRTSYSRFVSTFRDLGADISTIHA